MPLEPERVCRAPDGELSDRALPHAVEVAVGAHARQRSRPVREDRTGERVGRGRSAQRGDVHRDRSAVGREERGVRPPLPARTEARVEQRPTLRAGQLQRLPAVANTDLDLDTRSPARLARPAQHEARGAVRRLRLDPPQPQRAVRERAGRPAIGGTAEDRVLGHLLRREPLRAALRGVGERPVMPGAQREVRHVDELRAQRGARGQRCRRRHGDLLDQLEVEPGGARGPDDGDLRDAGVLHLGLPRDPEAAPEPQDHLLAGRGWRPGHVDGVRRRTLGLAGRREQLRGGGHGRGQREAERQVPGVGERDGEAVHRAVVQEELGGEGLGRTSRAEASPTLSVALDHHRAEGVGGGAGVLRDAGVEVGAVRALREGAHLQHHVHPRARDACPGHRERSERLRGLLQRPCDRAAPHRLLVVRPHRAIRRRAIAVVARAVVEPRVVEAHPALQPRVGRVRAQLVPAHRLGLAQRGVELELDVPLPLADHLGPGEVAHRDRALGDPPLLHRVQQRARAVDPAEEERVRQLGEQPHAARAVLALELGALLGEEEAHPLARQVGGGRGEGAVPERRERSRRRQRRLRVQLLHPGRTPQEPGHEQGQGQEAQACRHRSSPRSGRTAVDLCPLPEEKKSTPDPGRGKVPGLWGLGGVRSARRSSPRLRRPPASPPWRRSKAGRWRSRRRSTTRARPRRARGRSPRSSARPSTAAPDRPCR